MNVEEAIRKADFSRHAAAHKEALRATLFKKARKRPPVRELTLDDLDGVAAASKAWTEREKNFPNS